MAAFPAPPCPREEAAFLTFDLVCLPPLLQHLGIALAHVTQAGMLEPGLCVPWWGDVGQ